jgi:hypothetical protein
MNTQSTMRIVLICLLISVTLSLESNAQNPTENQSLIKHFNGTITATNNGVSIIPSFTLGRPAVFFDLNIGGERLTFEPMFRFGMDGKPWSFVLWWRYKIIKDKRFSLTAGAHPAFLFKEMEVLVDGKPEKMMVSKRYLAMELSPSFQLTPKSSLGIYFLKGHGFDPDPPVNSTFVGFNWTLKNVPISENLSFKMTPQFYYLKVDENDGVYVTSTFTFTHQKLPFGVASTLNQKLNSTIAGDDFVWNIALLYNFANQFTKKR